MAGPCYLSDLKDPGFDTDQVADIWKYAKSNYIDKGAKFEDTIKGVANDLGLKPD